MYIGLIYAFFCYNTDVHNVYIIDIMLVWFNVAFLCIYRCNSCKATTMRRNVTFGLSVIFLVGLRRRTTRLYVCEFWSSEISISIRWSELIERILGSPWCIPFLAPCVCLSSHVSRASPFATRSVPAIPISRYLNNFIINAAVVPHY